MYIIFILWYTFTIGLLLFIFGVYEEKKHPWIRPASGGGLRPKQLPGGVHWCELFPEKTRLLGEIERVFGCVCMFFWMLLDVFSYFGCFWIWMCLVCFVWVFLDVFWDGFWMVFGCFWDVLSRDGNWNWGGRFWRRVWFKPETIPMEKGELRSTEMPGGEQVYQQPGGLWPPGTPYN